MASLLLLKSMLFANAIHKSKKEKKKKIKKSSPQHTLKINVKLCRICNDEIGNIPIFDNIKQPNIPEEIEHFSGVTMTKSDNMSEHICQSCLDLLNGCILFRDMCQKSNKIMLELAIKEEHNYHEVVNNHQDNTDIYINIPSLSPSPTEFDSDIWACSTCSKEFYDLASYDSHLAKCNPEASEELKSDKKKKRTYLCDICGKVAGSISNLQNHKGIHENIFPFKCDVCPYRGRTLDLLKVHKRSHLAEKPFKCLHCDKATTTASNLAKHVRHVHSSTKPYKCTYCDKAFSYQHDMRQHVRDIHLRQRTVACNLCFKEFNTKKILRGHQRKIHKIKAVRMGRLPSYLQHQMQMNENNVNNY